MSYKLGKCSDRDNSVSIAKAIAIILVVAGHSWINSPLESFVLMFNVPLFFIMSGYCFKENHLLDTRTFILKKIRGIYLPYVKFSLLFLFLHNLFFRINIYNAHGFGYMGRSGHLYTLKDTLQHLFSIVLLMHGHDELLGAFWFLPQLFFGVLIFYILIKRVDDLRVLVLSLLLLTIILKAIEFRIPYTGIDSNTPLAAFFILCGYLLKKKGVMPNTIYASIGVVILIVINRFLPISVHNYRWYNLPLFIVYALIGSYGIWSFSKVLSASSILSKWLVFVGDHSLEILTFHFLSFKLINLLIIKINHLPIEYLASFPTMNEYSERGWWIAYLLCGVIVPTVYAGIRLKFTNRLYSQIS